MKFRGLNVSTRLSLSFAGATIFTVVASIVAVYSFNQMTRAMDNVAQTLLPTMASAYQLAQQSEGTVASAPAVVSATAQSGRQSAYYRVRDQIERLEELIVEIRAFGQVPEHTLLAVQEEKDQIDQTFERLNKAVEQRIDFNVMKRRILDRLVGLRSNQSSRFNEIITSRSLSTTHASMVNEIHDIMSQNLDILIITAQAAHSFGVDRRQSIFDENLVRAKALINNLPNKLRLSLQSGLTDIKAFGIEPDSMFSARRGELKAESVISGQVARYSHFSSRLVFTVSELILNTRERINAARIETQDLSTRESALLLILSLFCIGGALLVAADVSRNVIQRLRALEQGMVAGAKGEAVLINSNGTDEIASMSVALEHFIEARDIAENDLRDARDDAEVANLAKTKFLAAASHDLRQPLQALGLFVTALQNGALPDRELSIIGRIEDSLESLEALLDSLLEVSKLDAGVVVPNITTFPLGPLMDRLSGEFETIISAKGLSLRTVPTNKFIISDPFLLERILRNFLSNATRYTSAGRILLGCRQKGDMLRIEVWDTGPGIPPDKINLIFQEFHQLDNPSRERTKGLGLGLAIVRRTASLLAHEIDVFSPPHGGAAFSIQVPIGATALKPVQNREDDKAGHYDLTDRTVMVIDDEEAIRYGMETLLESWGGRIICAGSTDEALSKLNGEALKIDALICDYQLPNDEKGDHAIARIREHLKVNIPALIITGAIAPERRDKIEEQNIPLVHKPVSVEKIYEFLHQAIHDKQI